MSKVARAESIPLENILQWVRAIAPEAQLFLIPTRARKNFPNRLQKQVKSC
jgi:hypothetical protein